MSLPNGSLGLMWCGKYPRSHKQFTIFRQQRMAHLRQQRGSRHITK